MKFLNIFLSLFLFSKVVAQCPTTSQITSSGKCIKLVWATPPSPLPAYVTYTGTQYNFDNGLGTGASPAEYRDPAASGACSSYSGANANITLPSGQVCNYVGGVLPVSFSSVVATMQNNTIQLSWNYNEVDILQYKILKGFDGVSFNEIAILPTLSNGLQHYYYKDNAAVGKDLYYKVVAVSRQGTQVTSNIAKIITVCNDIIKTFPNPSNGNITLSVTDKSLLQTKVNVVSITGKLMKQIVLTNAIQSVQLQLSKGIYYLQFANNKHTKILIQ